LLIQGCRWSGYCTELDLSLLVSRPPKVKQTSLADQSLLPGQVASLSFQVQDLFQDPGGLMLALHATFGGAGIPDWVSFEPNPTLLASVEVPRGSGGSLFVNEPYLYVFTGTRFIIFDITDANNPALIYSQSSSLQADFQEGNRLYVQTNSQPFDTYVIDVTDVSAPTTVQLDIPSWLGAVHDDIAYVSGRFDLGGDIGELPQVRLYNESEATCPGSRD